MADYLIHSLRGLRREVFVAVYLDAAHAVIDSEILSEGTVNVNTVYPRELLKAALAQGRHDAERDSGLAAAGMRPGDQE